MKHYALVAAAAMFVSMSSAAFAECDTHKGDRDTDKQTACSEKCEDAFTSGKQHYGSNVDKLKQEAAACFEKCGCAEHGAQYMK